MIDYQTDKKLTEKERVAIQSQNYADQRSAVTQNNNERLSQQNPSDLEKSAAQADEDLN